MGRRRIGSQKPTFSARQPYSKSLGPEAIALYECTGRKARKWQAIQVKELMAVTPKGLWKHTKYGLAVPRQNGKNEIVLIRELKGLERGEKIIHPQPRNVTAIFTEGVDSTAFSQDQKSGPRRSATVELWSEDYQSEQRLMHNDVLYEVRECKNTGRGTVLLKIEEVWR